MDRVDTNQPLNWALQDAMAPCETRWTVGLGFVHYYVGAQGLKRATAETINSVLVGNSRVWKDLVDKINLSITEIAMSVVFVVFSP